MKKTVNGIYPMKLKPALKSYIWGGKRLKTEYSKGLNLEKVAESWELSCHADGLSVISNGEYKGLTLAEYIKSNNWAMGKNSGNTVDFPVLVKLLDTAENLSVQVHPDDEYAMKNEGQNGKTELWYIIDCEDGAELIYGFKRDISKSEFKERIEKNTLLEVLNSVKVKPGDVFYIKAGTIHAVGKGILLAEIQQNSNLTYRVYDFGRTDTNGNKRELHIDKALDVTCLNSSSLEFSRMSCEVRDNFNKTLLRQTEYFTAYLYDVKSEVLLNAGEDSFHSLLIIDGCAEIDGERFEKGDCCFISAGYGDYTVSGRARLIKVHNTNSQIK